jgi:hypothetical protein
MKLMVWPINETARKTATMAQAQTWGKAVPLQDWRTDKSVNTPSSAWPGWAISAASDVERGQPAGDDHKSLSTHDWEVGCVF